MTSRKPAARPAPKPSRTTPKKRPGRPEGTRDIRNDILDTAEILFAERGYVSTTLREIANATDVTQALVNYYFGSKQALFEEVFMRRGDIISQQRTESLRDLIARSDQPPTVREIVQAFLMPALHLREEPQGRAFLRLQSRLHTEPPAVSYALRAKAYETSTQTYIAALQRAMPDLPEREVYWRTVLMIGTYLYAFSDTHRLEALAPPGLYDPEDSHTLIDQVTRFVTAGFSAP